MVVPRKGDLRFTFRSGSWEVIELQTLDQFGVPWKSRGAEWEMRTR